MYKRQLWDLIESGELKTRLENIHDEVVEIHGEADSIPIADTFEFLKTNLRNVKLIAIPHAGHFPWIEKTSVAEFKTQLMKVL